MDLRPGRASDYLLYLVWQPRDELWFVLVWVTVPVWNLYRFWNMDRLLNSHPCARLSITVDDPGYKIVNVIPSKGFFPFLLPVPVPVDEQIPHVGREPRYRIQKT